MYSLILNTATRVLLPLLLLFSVFLLVRGHNEPGGGFVGGLMATTAFALHMVANDADATRRLVRFEPIWFVAFGLAFAAANGAYALLLWQPFLTAFWDDYSIPAVGKLGTPLVFDACVYLVVFGAVLTMILSFAEE